MPDDDLADGLIATARGLIADETSPRDARLRRAVSTAYYAMFHALARDCADSLVGSDAAVRPGRAWVEVYRGLDHGTSKDGCEKAKGVDFPEEVKEFAAAFTKLQELRHLCDHDPLVRITETQAGFHPDLAEESVAALRAARDEDWLAFATWALIGSRGKGVSEARRRARLSGPSRIDTA